MRIAVVAANGRSGKVFVERALADGHFIRAGVHSAHAFTPHPHLEIVHCDATVRAEVEPFVKGQDAVVSFIGHVKGSPARVQANAMRVLSEVMSERGVRRLVSLTGTGVRFPDDRIGLVDRFLNTGIALVDPERIADGKAHVELLQESDLDWTVLRVLKLQNVASKPFRLTLHGPTKWFVGRGDVAEAALQVLRDESFIKQSPILSRP